MVKAIGLNSGSSFDGVDAVLIELTDGPDGYPQRPTYRDGLTVPWPQGVAEQVLRAFENKLTLFELCRLNYVAGAVYAEAARALMRQCRLVPGEVEVIGYDGQTIYQEPASVPHLPEPGEDIVGQWFGGPYPCGLQIGEPAVVATVCDTPVVTQFRPSDHALGGTGAPLMQYLDYVAFRDIGPVLTLNIGGIANCQLADYDRNRMMAFDTGPGNVMIDHATRVFFGRSYDPDGSLAAAGRVDPALLADLMNHAFFRREPPRSAWRLDFGSTFADERIAASTRLEPHDIVATFTAFAAASIVRSITDHVGDLARFKTLIASGGGVRNKTLMASIQAKLPDGMRLALSDEFGIPAQFKEAVKFATLAHATLHRFANNIPAASGARRFTVMGKTVLPPRMATFTA